MKTERISELYARKLSGEASPAELEELESLFQNEQEEQFYHEIIENWWEFKKDNEGLQKEQEDHFNYLMDIANANCVDTYPTKKKGVTKIVTIPNLKRVLAVAAVFIGIYWTFQWGNLHWKFGSPESMNEIIAKRGTKSKLILPDGTQVWLNSESKLSYNSNFNEPIREVFLDGEAFFDVVKDKHRPFVVKTSAINIKVLGTAFNVKSYKQDPTIEATLVRGLIEVQKNNEISGSKIILKPNEKLVFNKLNTQQSTFKAEVNSPITQPQLISISSIPKNIADSIRKETSWIYGKLVFDGDSFISLSEKMERWYNVQISIKDTSLAKHRFVGVFENENIVEALKALQLITKFNYRIENNEILIEK